VLPEEEDFELLLHAPSTATPRESAATATNGLLILNSISPFMGIMQDIVHRLASETVCQYNLILLRARAQKPLVDLYDAPNYLSAQLCQSAGRARPKTD
jgi:hypothetical protein